MKEICDDRKKRYASKEEKEIRRENAESKGARFVIMERGKKREALYILGEEKTLSLPE